LITLILVYHTSLFFTSISFPHLKLLPMIYKYNGYSFVIPKNPTRNNINNNYSHHIDFYGLFRIKTTKGSTQNHVTTSGYYVFVN